MATSDPPPEDALSDLRRRVDAAQGKAASNSSSPQSSAASLALRFGGEFGAAVIVGALFGFGADQLLPISPWGLVTGLGLGFCAGIVNMTRVAREYSRKHKSGGETND